MGILSIISLWRLCQDRGGTQGKHYDKTTQTVLMLERINPKRLQETNREEERWKQETEQDRQGIAEPPSSSLSRE